MTGIWNAENQQVQKSGGHEFACSSTNQGNTYARKKILRGKQDSGNNQRTNPCVRRRPEQETRRNVTVGEEIQGAAHQPEPRKLGANTEVRTEHTKIAEGKQKVNSKVMKNSRLSQI
jgi:hypothetical protein